MLDAITDGRLDVARARVSPFEYRHFGIRMDERGAV